MKLENLTKEQEDLMIVIREKWINQLYSLPKINKNQFQKGINWLYKFCKLEEPTIYYCKSPLEAQLLCHILKNNIRSNVENNVRDNVGNDVRNNVVRNVLNNVGRNVKNNVGNNVWNNIENNIWNNVWNNVLNNVGNNVENNVENNVGRNVKNNVFNNVGRNVENNVGNNVRNNVFNNVFNNVGRNVRNNVGNNVLNNVRNNVGNNVGNNVENNVENNVRDNVENNVLNNVRDNVWDNVEYNVWNNVRDNVWNNVWDNVWKNVENNVRDNVENNVLNNVWDNVWKNVENNVRDNVENNVGNNVRDNVENNVLNNVRDNVRDNVVRNVVRNVKNNVRDNIGNNVLNNVENNVFNNVGNNVLNNVENNVGRNVENNVGRNVENINNFIFEHFCSYGNLNDFGWVSFYDFFTQINVLDNQDFNSYSELLQSGYYTMIQLDKVVICVENPKHIKLQNNQLHCINDYAIKWQDDTGMNFINGRYLEEELFFKILKNEFFVEDFIKIDNEETKSTCIAFLQIKHGDNFLVEFFKDSLKKIDTFVDNKIDKFLKNTKGMNVGVYDLFKGTINNLEVAYVRCYCPSTDRMFFLGVENSNTNAKDAIASLCKIPVKLKDEIKSINRQGERFSFVWTDRGQKIKKTMNKTDWQNTVSLTGNVYFSKMQFEY